MFSILAQPHPRFERDVATWWLCVGAGLFVGLFIVIFQPFGTDRVIMPGKYLFLAGFGLITSLVLVTNYFALPALFPAWFREERWTVGRNIVFVLGHFLGIAVLNYFYTTSVFGISRHIPGLLSMIGFTLIIGVFPTTAFTITTYVKKLKKYSQPPQPEPLSPQELATETQQYIQFTAENGKDQLRLPVTELLYIESADNYSEIVFQENEQLRKELLRSSLSRLETQISYDFIVRCHRSYIVNLHRVERVSGNAQGYKLHLRSLDMPVPVARKYSELVTERFH